MGGEKTLLFCCFERDEVFFSRARARPSTSPLSRSLKVARLRKPSSLLSVCFEELKLSKNSPSPLCKKEEKTSKKTPKLKTQKKTIRWLKTRSACPLCNKEWEFAKIEKILQGGDGAAGGGG